METPGHYDKIRRVINRKVIQILTTKHRTCPNRDTLGYPIYHTTVVMGLTDVMSSRRQNRSTQDARTRSSTQGQGKHFVGNVDYTEIGFETYTGSKFNKVRQERGKVYKS